MTIRVNEFERTVGIASAHFGVLVQHLLSRVNLAGRFNNLLVAFQVAGAGTLGDVQLCPDIGVRAAVLGFTLDGARQAGQAINPHELLRGNVENRHHPVADIDRATVFSALLAHVLPSNQKSQ